MRKCSKCEIEKPLSDYYFRKDTNRYFTICKSCCKNKQKKYHKAHIIDAHNYYVSHKDYFKQYMKENGYKYKGTCKKYYQDNKYRLQNKQKEYYKNNCDKIKAYNKQYKVNKKENDEVYKKQCYISSRIRQIFNKKGECNYKSIESIIGINCKDFYKYLLDTFMDNYGFKYDGREVHIDHKKPLSTTKDMNDLVLLNHYTNLQLLIPGDNMSKWKHIDIDYLTKLPTNDIINS